MLMAMKVSCTILGHQSRNSRLCKNRELEYNFEHCSQCRVSYIAQISLLTKITEFNVV